MDESGKVYVGLDVHNETIAIARALPGREPAIPGFLAGCHLRA